eukprot:gnl/TRDRNA2_/TRDRNA2_182222_c0_seq1.p1 gnl/TRDRNA2_/TRDRNA2_182222_c0~~gnl/TRDRNA2_/TRDRNA2_182222_c0_seq1.p1  ORF type:complete len:120 (-),score=18.37 gnl/TRDRNA2_/TRDRNA2_182222_c0_seq1:98-457(-)
MVRMQCIVLVTLVAVAGAIKAKRQAPSVCHDLECADITCYAPFELTRNDGQCCAVCVASDEDVAIDRHISMGGPSPYAEDSHPAAPPTCVGVKCFTPVCYTGTQPGYVQGRCCESCVAR